MKKILFGFLSLVIFTFFSQTTMAAPAKATITIAQKQATPPAGYMTLIKKAQQEYLVASKKAKAMKSKKALKAAEEACAAALEKAAKMIES